MLAEAASRHRQQAVLTLPAIVRQGFDAVERQGKDGQSFLNVLKTSGPQVGFMLTLEKNRLLSKICEMPRGDDRDTLIAQAALLKNLTDALEAIK